MRTSLAFFRTLSRLGLPKCTRQFHLARSRLYRPSAGAQINAPFFRPQAIRCYGSATVSKSEAEERVLAVLRKFDKVDSTKLSLTTPFTQLGLDSLDVVEVMIALEEEFHMEIPDAVADKVQTSQEVADYIYGFLNPPKPQEPDDFSEDSTRH